MSESRQTHVTLHDIDPQALDQLVQFAYTAEIVVGEGNVQVRLPGPSLNPSHSSAGPLCLSSWCFPVPLPQSLVARFLVPAPLLSLSLVSPHRLCSQLPASCS